MLVVGPCAGQGVSAGVQQEGLTQAVVTRDQVKAGAKLRLQIRHRADLVKVQFFDHNNLAIFRHLMFVLSLLFSLITTTITTIGGLLPP